MHYIDLGNFPLNEQYDYANDNFNIVLWNEDIIRNIDLYQDLGNCHLIELIGELFFPKAYVL